MEKMDMPVTVITSIVVVSDAGVTELTPPHTKKFGTPTKCHDSERPATCPECRYPADQT